MLEDIEKRVVEQLFDGGKTIDEIADTMEKKTRLGKFLVQEYLYKTERTKCRFYSITGLESIVNDGLMEYAASADSVSELARGAGVTTERASNKLKFLVRREEYKDKLKPSFDWETGSQNTAEKEDSIIDKAIKAEAERLNRFMVLSTPEGMNKAIVDMATASTAEDRERALDLLTQLFDRNVQNKCGIGFKPNVFSQLGIDVPAKPSWFDERFMQALYIKTNLDVQKKDWGA